MKTKKLISLLVILILAGITTELGIWQLHRARDEAASTHPIADTRVYPISQVATAGANLTSRSLNKLVEIHGQYVKTYIARGQSFDPSKNVTKENTSGQVVSHPVDLDVRLMRIDGGTDSLLVVRGVAHSETTTHFAICAPVKNAVVITGRIYPRQTSDLSSASQSSTNSEISRLDPALVVGDAPGKIYDGYVVVNSEKFGSCDGTHFTSITMKRLPTPLIVATTAGFYWQHIAYVVIWWFFTLLILTLPFYNRLRARFSLLDNLAPQLTNSGEKS